MKNLIKRIKDLKLNFRLVLIALLGILIVLVILLSLLAPRGSSFIPFIPSGTSNFEVPQNTLVQNSSDGFFYNNDTIIVSIDKTTATYFFYDQAPSEEVVNEIKDKLGVLEVEIVDSSYKSVKENLLTDPYLDGTFREPPTD